MNSFSEVLPGGIRQSPLLDLSARLAGLSEAELTWVRRIVEAALQPKHWFSPLSPDAQPILGLQDGTRAKQARPPIATYQFHLGWAGSGPSGVRVSEAESCP